MPVRKPREALGARGMSLLKAEGAAADEDEEVLLQSWGSRKSDVRTDENFSPAGKAGRYHLHHTTRDVKPNPIVGK